MPRIPVEAELSADDLLTAVDQLNADELERFVQEVIMIQARRRAPSLPADESALLLRINEPIPPDVQRRFDQLIAKRHALALTSEEYAELLDLTDVVENLEAARVENLAALAALRQVPLRTLMDKLSIRPSTSG